MNILKYAYSVDISFRFTCIPGNYGKIVCISYSSTLFLVSSTLV